MNRDLKQTTQERMSKVQRSSPLSPFFSFILLLHFMVCSSHTARASKVSTVFGLDSDFDLYDDHLKKITKRLSARDAFSLSLTSKTAHAFKPLFIKYAIKSSEVHKEQEETVASQRFKASLEDAPSDMAQISNLYDKLVEACEPLSPSNQLSSQHATLLISGYTPIHMEHAVVLKRFFNRDKYGVSEREEGVAGNHSTHALGQIYIKADDHLFYELITPLDFMMEKAISLLAHYLFPQERLIANTQIGVFKGLRKAEVDYLHKIRLFEIPGLVQIAEKIEGILLEKVLKGVPSQGYDAWFKDNFSLASYQSFVLLSLLIRPADYKADNIMLKKEKDTRGQEVYHLVGIDNDMAFADSLVKLSEEATHVGVKNILYALPLMDEPFEQEIIQTISAWNPALIVIGWLKDLDHYNQHYAPLFEGRFKDKYDAIPLWGHAEGMLSEGEEPYPARFPLKLKKDTAVKLYENLCQLKKLTEETERVSIQQKPLTLHQTFAAIDPLLSTYYEWLREEYKKNLIYQGVDQAYINAGLELFKEEVRKKLEYLFNQGILDNTLQSYLRHSKESKAYLRERTQPINEASIDLFKIISLSDILSSKDLTPSVLRWVFDIIQPHIDNPRTTLNALLQAYPHKQSSISFELMDLLLSYCKKKLSGAQDENTLNGPQGPLNYHTFLNQEDTFARTPLDYALKTQDPKLITYLIQEGAQDLLPASLREMNALALQTQDASFYEGVKLLLDHYPQVHWQMTLEEVFPSPKDAPILLYALEPQKVHGMSSENLSYFIEQEPRTDLKKKEIKPIRHNTYGKRAVSWLKSGSINEGDIKNRTLKIGEHALYLKWKPEFPLLEMAAGKLMRLIMREGAPYSTLMHLRQGKVLSLPALASQAIEGLTLYDVLMEDRKDIYNNIDSASLSKALVMSMILNPEDGNPTNYIVEPIPLTHPQKYRLVCIDNERILVPSVATALIGHKQKTSLQVRTILYCLDAMKEPVHAEVLKIMEELDVFQTLKSWLQELNTLNKEGLKLFEPEEIKRLSQQHETIIGIPFVEGSIGDLYTRLMYFKTAIERHKEGRLTHFDLLRSIDPFLAARYQAPFKTIPQENNQASLTSILERWGGVDGEGYQTLKGEAWKPSAKIPPISTSSFSHFLPSLKLPSKEELQKKLWKNEMGPTQALKELSTIEEVHKDTSLLLKQVKGYKGPSIFSKVLNKKFTFKEGGHLSTKSKERALKKIFTQVNTGKLTLTAPQEEALFEGLTRGTDLKELMFTQSLTMTTELLKHINTRYLTSVDISGAYKIDNDFINQLINFSPNLVELYINHMKALSSLDINAPNSSIKKLYAQGGINKLRKVTLNISSLESLDLSSNPLLMTFELEAPNLKVLNIKDSANINVLRLENILKLELLINGIEAYVSPFVLKTLKGMNPSVEEFSLSNNTLKDLDFYYLMVKDAFKHIKILSLAYCSLGAKSISTLSKSPLGSNLSSLSIIDNKVGYEDAIAISENSTLTSLSSLYLAYNKICSKGVMAISQSSILTNLTLLQLSLNEIGDEGAIAISQSSTLTNLTSLSLAGNKIGSKGLVAISQSLILTNLKLLELSVNEIGDEGAIAISQSSTLTNLTSLNLWRNNIELNGIKALKESKMLTNLKNLDL